MLLDVLARLLSDVEASVKGWVPEEVQEIQPMIEAFQPDLLLVDYHMPVCKGPTVARLALESLPNLKIVLMTASHDRGIQEFMDQGLVDELVFKPISKDMLIELIDRYRPTSES